MNQGRSSEGARSVREADEGDHGRILKVVSAVSIRRQVNPSAMRSLETTAEPERLSREPVDDLTRDRARTVPLARTSSLANAYFLALPR